MIEDIRKTLWPAANKLLAKVDAAECKHNVLGLIFVKYISDIYLALRQFNFDSLSSTFSIANAVNSKAVKGLPILVPMPNVVAAFNDHVGPLFARIKQLENQAQTLATLRDTLLLRLISGQLRLPETEALVEEV